MKITDIETFVVDAGWRPWQFCAVRTDEGITGYGEMSDGRNPYGVIGTVSDYEPILLGQDPLAVEARYWDMYRMSRQAPGGIAARAIAGVELALWDIKGKALGVPVHSLFGGPTRQQQQVYWSHCGSSRSRNHEIIGTPPMDSFDCRHRTGTRGEGARLQGAQDEHHLLSTTTTTDTDTVSAPTRQTRRSNRACSVTSKNTSAPSKRPSALTSRSRWTLTSTSNPKPQSRSAPCWSSST